MMFCFDEPVRSRSPAPGSINRASKWRGANDFYPTPPAATEALCRLDILPEKIWEPACGDGAMAKVLIYNQYQVLATDLFGYGFGTPNIDFLATSKCHMQAIVTNPPFNLAEEFVNHALDLEPMVAAFFLRLKFLEGRRRYDSLMSMRPPSDVYVFIERVKFFSGDHAEADQPGWNTEAFAWFVWDRGVNRAPAIHWISGR